MLAGILPSDWSAAPRRSTLAHATGIFAEDETETKSEKVAWDVSFRRRLWILFNESLA